MPPTTRSEQPGSSSLWHLPALRRQIVLALLSFGGFFVTLSSIPLWAVDGGVPEGLAGLATTVMLAATVATQLFVPAMVRRFGQPVVLAAGLIALGAPTPLLLLDRDLWWLLVVSAIRGLGFAVVTVLMPIVATQIAPPGRHGEAIGIYGLAIAIPNLIAIPLSVALTTAGHFAVVAWIGALPLLALPLIRSFPAPAPVTTDPRDPGAGRARVPVGALTGITLVLLVITMIGGGLLAILPVQLPSGSLATVALLLFGLTSAVARWRSGVLADRTGSRPLLVGGLVFAVVALLLMSGGLLLDPGPTRTVMVLVGAAILGVGYGAVQNLSLLVSFVLAGPDRRATASALWNATFDAGTAVGALLIGAVAAGAGLGPVLAGCAALVAATLLPAWRSTPR
ncbi:MFS transporter [Nakamurella alba]|nr:MFS transporter [Nakamurella alba]